jgi:hypothetical protein
MLFAFTAIRYSIRSMAMPSGCLLSEEMRWAKEKWKLFGPDDYAYLYKIEAAFLQSKAVVWVKDGNSIGYLNRLDPFYKGDFSASDFQTVEQLFAKLEESGLCNPQPKLKHVVRVTFDPLLGFPRKIESDYQGLLDAWSVQTLEHLSFLP